MQVTEGEAPLVVSIPHAGTSIPDSLLHRFSSSALARADADWYLERIYDVATSVGATVVRTAISRTVIDMNRDPEGRALYPGMASTDLCPLTTFDGEPLYRQGAEPDAVEVESRKAVYYKPYHAALQRHLSRLRQRHAKIVLFDAHSIRSRVPRLFEGALPVFNLGTNSGASCSPDLTTRLEGLIEQTGESWVTNGRFKGGYITRAYGQPTLGVHAVQLETALRAYLDEPAKPDLGGEGWPPPFEVQRAARMRGLVQRLLAECVAFASAGG